MGGGGRDFRKCNILESFALKRLKSSCFQRLLELDFELLPHFDFFPWSGLRAPILQDVELVGLLELNLLLQECASAGDAN